MGLRRQSERRRRAHDRAGLRSVPDRSHEGGIRRRRGRVVSEHDHPGDRRHAEDNRSRDGKGPRHAAGPQRGAAHANPGERTRAGAAMRRLRRLFGRHGQSRARRRSRPPRSQWRHRDPVGNAGDLRRRASFDPPPGNKAGGLTTILEKSLGAAAKGGTTTLNAVYKYAEPVTDKGFVFMDTPGYDPVSVTGQVAGGATIVAFTTGRGSAFGCKPTPSIKLATNSDVYRRMVDDMDINCGDVLDGVSIDDKGKEIFDKILAVASGARTKSEELGYGESEFTPWQIGATM